MTRIFLSKWHVIALMGAILAGLSVSGCQVIPQNMQQGGSNYDQKPGVIQGVERSVVTPLLMQYRYGLPAATTSDNTAYLKAQYDDWKAHYVTASGAGGYLRVQRDLATAYDTVSEGLGYGMLLAVYFDDQATFDQLYNYVKSHLTSYGLMHWVISNNNVNISEFGLPVPHGAPYRNWNTGAYVTTNTYMGVTNDPDYIRAAQWDRQISDAFDASEDIATALILASARWDKNERSYYARAAFDNITNIFVSDIDADYIKNGKLWGGSKGWNPSYFVPAWYKLYIKFLNNYGKYVLTPNVFNILTNRFQLVIDNMYDQMAVVELANSPAGLFPDWVNTSSGIAQKCVGLSDRRYYLDESPSIPNINGVDDRNGDGKITFADDGYDMMSFNDYYDGVRVPWRLAIDFSWYGDTRASNMVAKIGAFYKDKLGTANPNHLVDGYSINGDPWEWTNRDGFNDAKGGQWYSSTFVAMNAATVLTYGDSSFAQQFYTEVQNNMEPYAYSNNYYGNTLRLLSLVYLSGKFINYYDTSAVKFARLPAQYVTTGPLTIDLAYTNYGVYGLTHCDFHDRASLFSADGLSYADIGSGTLGTTVNDQMILGQAARVGNIFCSLKTLWLREPFIEKVPYTDGANICAKGDITGRAWQFSGGVIMSNLNQDVGSMDFSVDMTKFTPDTSKNVNLEPGVSGTLTPGNYGDVTLKGRNKLTLSSGVYQLNSYSAEPDVTNYLNTANGPVIIFVKGDFNMKSRIKMLNPADNKGADPTKILIVTGSANMVYIADDVSFRGTLIAPNTSYLNVDICNTDITNVRKVDWKGVTMNGDVFGAIWGKYTVVHQVCAINFVPFDWSAAISKGLAKKK